jgi:VanZ family protein
MSSANTGTRLRLALLGYMLGITLVVTLMPFRFGAPDELRVIVTGSARDLLANILLFIPLGFLYRSARPPRRPRWALSVLLVGALASMAIEAAQLFLSVRDASALDVLANAFGAWLGACAFDCLARYGGTEGRLLGRLGLELPIMGLIYLLIPLLWVSSLASHSDVVRHSAVLLLGVVGAILVGGVQQHYVRGARPAVPGKAAVFASLWFLLGTFPLLRSKPLYVLIWVALVGVLCWQVARQWARVGTSERRFELRLLKATAPFFAAYLALIIITPLHGEPGVWRLWLGFPTTAVKQTEIVRLLELVASFTLVGYMVAEARGRAVLHFGAALPRLMGSGAALAILAEVPRGYSPGDGASVARGTLLILAALYGGWLYYLQRAHAMKLLTEPTNADGEIIAS